MKTQVYHSIEKEIMHVHTKRCKHAENVDDREYVEKAIGLGAKRIVFTDHCPFPKNPFGQRMELMELAEYLEACRNLKKEYENTIQVFCGLEAEFIPEYWNYYLELKDNEDIDILALGQHFYRREDGYYSFEAGEENNEDGNGKKIMNYAGLCSAMVQGINTGIFDVVFHPDRAFEGCETFGMDEFNAAKSLIWAASWNGVYLEKNDASIHGKPLYWDEFWKLVPAKALTLNGVDAHSVKELKLL